MKRGNQTEVEPEGPQLLGLGLAELLAGDLPVGAGQAGVILVELLHVGGDLVRLLKVVGYLEAVLEVACEDTHHDLQKLAMCSHDAAHGGPAEGAPAGGHHGLQVLADASGVQVHLGLAP